MRVAASRLERVLNCDGSFEMEAPLQSRAQSQDQKDGDAAHEAAHMLLTGVVQLAEELTERRMSNGVYVTGEMVNHIEEYVTHVTDWTGFESEMEGVVEYEKQTTLLNKVDAYNVGEHIVEVADLKYGWRVVEAYPNFQMISYVIALRQMFPHASTFRMTIIQPRPYHRDGTLRSYDLSAELVDDYALRIAQTIEARDPGVLKTGMHCRYCKAYSTCSAITAATFNAVDVTESAATENMTPGELAQTVTDLRRAKQLIEEKLNVCEEQAVGQISNGVYIPGYGVKPSLGNYAWMKGMSAESIKAITGIDPTADKVVTPAQLKKKGANEDVVKAITYRPNLGFKLILEKDAKSAFKAASKG